MATSGMSGRKENTQLMAAVLPHITQTSRSARLRPYNDSRAPQVTAMAMVLPELPPVASSLKRVQRYIWLKSSPKTPMLLSAMKPAF